LSHSAILQNDKLEAVRQIAAETLVNLGHPEIVEEYERQRREKIKANRQKMWTSRGIIGECPDCGKLVTRSQAKTLRMPLSPGWNQVIYYCPRCYRDSGD
jgi:hypothetical protein